MTTPLTDESNVQMERVPEDAQGLTVEEAYRLLSDMKPGPVRVEPEE